MNEIVNYANDFNQLPLKNFNACELDLLMVLCNRGKDKGTEPQEISFKDIRRLANYEAKDNRRLADDIRRTNKKLLELNIMLRESDNPGTTVQFALFKRFRTSEEEEKLEFAVNEEFAFILNQLSSDFTKFELVQFTSLKSKYSKELFRQLKQYRSTGWRQFDIEEFRELLDIPKSYRISNINDRVLKVAMEELEPYFSCLSYETLYKKGKGNPVKGYRFDWTPEEVKSKSSSNFISEKEEVKPSGHICPACGKALYERTINGSNCWCHLEGWKEDADCNLIFNSVYEIMTFK